VGFLSLKDAAVTSNTVDKGVFHPTITHVSRDSARILFHER